MIVWGIAKTPLEVGSSDPRRPTLKRDNAHPTSGDHHISGMHNWRLLRKIIINLILSRRPAITQMKHNPALGLSLHLAHLLPLHVPKKM